MKIGIYPGSFDPMTIGHLDILKEASGLFDKVYIAVLRNSAKTPVFSVEERTEMIQKVIEAEGIENAVCESFDGLLVDFARKKGASFIVRGLRATSDFEYEFQIDAVNRHLEASIKTIYFMASPEHSFLSSSNVREMGYWGGNISGLVPDAIRNIISERLLKK